MNKGMKELSDQSFQGFRNHVIKDFDISIDTAVQIRKRAPSMVTPPPPAKRSVSQTPASAQSAVDTVTRRVPVSPEKPKVVLNMPKYNERKNAGKVLVKFNPENLPKLESSGDCKIKCEIKTEFETNVTKPYRFMFTPLEEKSKVLDEHLISFGEEIMEKFNNEAEIEAVGVPRQEKVTCVGRICNEVSCLIPSSQPFFITIFY